MIKDANLSVSLQSLSTILAARPAIRPLTERAQSLHARLDRGRFHLAVLGQFKRGKSTLLNALLGESFLPTGVVPITSIPTLLEYGLERQVRVLFQDGAAKVVSANELAAYVTEAANAGNKLGVARVEVRHPSPLLAQGLVLIDTPGIGSTLAHNTLATMGFLGEIDAAFFLISADPPMTAVELDFLAVVRRRVGRLFFLLNKVDYLTPEQQQEAINFLEVTLRKQGGFDSNLQLFPISARLALESKQERNEAGWAASGMAAVEELLIEFMHNEKEAALEGAIAAKTMDLVAEALQLLQTERRALTMPLDELRDKRQAFQEALIAARRQRQTAADLLRADEKHMVERINRQAGALFREAETYLAKAAEAALAADEIREAEDLARDQLAAAAKEFFEVQYEPFSRAMHAEMLDVLQKHADEADSLVSEVRHLAADLFAFDFLPLSPDESPARPRAPYWVGSVLEGGWGFPLSRELWERLLPEPRRRQRISSRLRLLATRLASRNAENLRWAVVQNSQQVMRQFQRHLDQRWQEAIETTALVLEAAVARREQHEADSAASFDQLDEQVGALQALALRLQPVHHPDCVDKGVHDEHKDTVRSRS